MSMSWLDDTAVAARRQKPRSLRQALVIVWVRWKLVAATFACTVGLAALYVALTPSSYTAQSVILLDPRQTRVTEGPDVLAGIGADTAAIASQVEVLRSRGLLTEVFKSEGLGSERSFEDFRKRVIVQRQGTTYVIEVSFTSEDPEKSARVVNAIVKRYLANEVAERVQASSDASVFLDHQIKTLRDRLNAAENALESFKAEHGIVSLDDGRTLIRSEVDKVSVQLLAAREQARVSENRYQQASALGASGESLAEFQKIASSGAIDALRAGYNQRVVEFARVQAAFGPKHPAYVYASSELTRYNGLIRAEVARFVSQLRAERDLAKANVAKAEAEMAQIRAKSEQSDQSQVQMRQLERDVDASSKVLEQFLRRTREIGEAEKLQNARARVIGIATPPDRAAWPKAGLILSSAGFYGLAFGIALAIYLGMPAVQFGRRRRDEHTGNIVKDEARKAA